MIGSFGIASGEFAEAPPLGRFRLVGGALYAMVSTPEAFRIVRFDLDGGAA
jgi:hypothetical protein